MRGVVGVLDHPVCIGARRILRIKTSMSEIFDESTTFEALGLRGEVLAGVADAGFAYPNRYPGPPDPADPGGQGCHRQAKTGTGKTAAFGLPILQRADKDVPLQVLILVPTRELAAQVTAEIMDLGKHTPIRCACIIGGESMRAQVRSVQGGAHIMVGTPGRVMDLQGRGEIHFNNLRTVVLDEVDRMLDIGFREDIARFLKTVRQDHQTIFCSATISEDNRAAGPVVYENRCRQDPHRLQFPDGFAGGSEISARAPWTSGRSCCIFSSTSGRTRR